MDTSVPLCIELSERTIRIITSRLNKLKDFILDRFKKNNKSASSKHNIQFQMLKKYEEEKEMYELYNGLLERHKVLYSLKLDLHELKGFLLRVMDPNYPIPTRPKFVPLPQLDIRAPQAPNIVQQRSTGNRKVSHSQRQDGDSDEIIYQSMMSNNTKRSGTRNLVHFQDWEEGSSVEQDESDQNCENGTGEDTQDLIKKEANNQEEGCRIN